MIEEEIAALNEEIQKKDSEILRLEEQIDVLKALAKSFCTELVAQAINM